MLVRGSFFREKIVRRGGSRVVGFDRAVSRLEEESREFLFFSVERLRSS